jgi:hypothetical protein
MELSVNDRKLWLKKYFAIFEYRYRRISKYS